MQKAGRKLAETEQIFCSLLHKKGTAENEVQMAVPYGIERKLYVTYILTFWDHFWDHFCRFVVWERVEKRGKTAKKWGFVA